VAHDDITRDGKTEASAACFAVAGPLQPLERREGALRLIGRNARTIVPDVDDERGGVVGERDAHLAAIFAAIVDQVGEGPP
jgi:hypothetical protein